MPVVRSSLLVGAMDMGTATWVMAVAVITTAGAEATITVGDNQQAEPAFLEAASLGGFFIHISALFGHELSLFFGKASLTQLHRFRCFR